MIASIPVAGRIINIVLGVAVIVSILMAKDRDFLGFYRPADSRHVIYDISIFCGYLVCGWMIYRGFVPKQKKTGSE